MLESMKLRPDKMRQAAAEGFINATDLADYMVRKGEPFRSAYQIIGRLVADCIREGQILENLPLERYQSYSPLFEQDLYEAIDLEICVSKRTSQGGTAPSQVEAQLKLLRQQLEALQA